MLSVNLDLQAHILSANWIVSTLVALFSSEFCLRCNTQSLQSLVESFASRLVLVEGGGGGGAGGGRVEVHQVLEFAGDFPN